MKKLPVILGLLLLVPLVFPLTAFGFHTTFTNRITIRRTYTTPTITVRTPTPSPTISVKLTVTSTPTSVQTTDAQFYIMSEINKYRLAKGLHTVKTDSYTCSFAKVRAKEISSGFNHDGFRDRINNKALPYPSYSMVTENLAMTSNYKNVVNMWINSSGHAANMQKDTPLVCVEQYGNYFAYEGWKP